MKWLVCSADYSPIETCEALPKGRFTLVGDRLMERMNFGVVFFSVESASYQEKRQDTKSID